MSFEDTIERVLQHEGHYSDDPADSGGETIWGVTARVARACGYSGAMKDMTRQQAKAIYRRLFWDALRLDEVDALSSLVAYEVMDTAVNVGPQLAAKFLQRSLNVLNLQGKLYPDLKVDGQLGPATVSALRAYLAARKAGGLSVLLRMLNSLQGAHYVDLAERREKDERFVYGWFDARVVV